MLILAQGQRDRHCFVIHVKFEVRDQIDFTNFFAKVAGGNDKSHKTG